MRRAASQRLKSSAWSAERAAQPEPGGAAAPPVHAGAGAVCLALALATAAAFLIGFMILRLRLMYFSIVTLALSAIMALDALGVARPRCVGLIESGEESGSPDLPAEGTYTRQSGLDQVEHPLETGRAPGIRVGHRGIGKQPQFGPSVPGPQPVQTSRPRRPSS